MAYLFYRFLFSRCLATPSTRSSISFPNEPWQIVLLFRQIGCQQTYGVSRAVLSQNRNVHEKLPSFFLYTKCRPMSAQGKAFSLSDRGLRLYCIVHTIAQSQSCFCNAFSSRSSTAVSIVSTILLLVIHDHVRVLA